MEDFHFEATNDFIEAIAEVQILKNKAEDALEADNDSLRMMFLKLAVVNCVIKFQVFVEQILKEYKYKVTISGKKNKDLPEHLRLNWLRIALSDPKIENCLKNPSLFNSDKLIEVRRLLYSKYTISHDERSTCHEIQFETKFPMGKQGLKELAKLFKQINGENIFELSTLDKNRLNEILNIRHKIVHEDANPATLSEAKIIEYKNFICDLVKEIDVYTSNFC